MDAFNIIGKIFLDDSQFGAAAAKVGQSADKLGSKIGGALDTAGKAVIGITAAVGAAGAGLFALTTKAAESADQVQKMADITGMSAERIQELKYAGGQLGVELETITGAQAKLTKSMFAAQEGTGKQADAFAKLGISVTDGSGKLRDSKQIMTEAFNALNKVGNETERDALAMQLFGKSAMELNPLIKAGGDELARLSQEAADMGAVLSADKIAALDAFGDKIESLKMAFQGIAGSFASALLPAMSGVLEFFKGFAMDINNAIQSGNWESVGGLVGEYLDTALQKAVEALPSMLNVGLNIIQKLLDGIVSNLPTIINVAVQIIMTLVDFIVANIDLLINAAITIVMTLIEALINNIDKLIDAGLKILMALIDGLLNNIDKIIDAIIKITLKLVDIIIERLPYFVEVAIKIALAIIEGLVKATPKILGAIVEIIGKLIGAIIKTDWGKIGTDLINGIGKGFGLAFDALRNSMIAVLNSAVKAVKDWFGIKSPSKKMQNEIGEPMGQGLAIGFINALVSGKADMLATVIDISKEVAKTGFNNVGKAVGAMQNAIANSGNVGYNYAQSFSNALGTFKSLKDFGYTDSQIYGLAKDQAARDTAKNYGITQNIIINSTAQSPSDIANASKRGLQEAAFAMG